MIFRHVDIPTARDLAEFINTEAKREIAEMTRPAPGGFSGGWAPEDSVNDVARSLAQHIGRLLSAIVADEPWYVAKPGVRMLADELQRLEPGEIIK